MGFHKAAKYYYYPGWHEPGATLELITNKAAFNQLPPDLQAIVRAAASRANVWMLSEFEAKNNFYLKKLVDEHNVQLRKFPDDVLNTLRRYAAEVIDELVAKDAMSKKIYASFSEFQKNVNSWANLSEKEYYTGISS